MFFSKNLLVLICFIPIFVNLSLFKSPLYAMLGGLNLYYEKNKKYYGRKIIQKAFRES